MGKITDKRLYKYTNICHAIDSINNGVFASELSSLNDPYEAEGIIYSDDYRVACMTNSSRKMLMWSYYGNHRGCVLQYDVSAIRRKCPNIIRKVEYEETLRTPHRQMQPKEIFDSLYKKSKEWEHENEYRAVYYSGENDDYDIWKLDGSKIFLKAPVRKVIFGVAVSNDNSEYKKVLSYIRNYNENVGDYERIMVSKMYLLDNKYELSEDPQYDYERVMKRH